jgi:hypothetical protein
MTLGTRGSFLVDVMIGILLTSTITLTLGAYMVLQKRTELHQQDTAEFRMITHRILYDLNRNDRCSFALSGVPHTQATPIAIEFRSKNGPTYRTGYKQPGVRISRLALRILGTAFQQNAEFGDTALAQLILEGEKTREDPSGTLLGGRSFRPVFLPVLVRMEAGGAGRIAECVHLKGSAGSAICQTASSGEQQTVVGFTPDGNPVCAPLALAGISWDCPANQYLVGVHEGQPVCRSFVPDQRHNQARWGTSGSLPSNGTTPAQPPACASATIDTRPITVRLPGTNEYICPWSQGDALPERIGYHQASSTVLVSRALSPLLAPGERLCGIRSIESEGEISYDRQAALTLNASVVLLRGKGVRLDSFPQSPDGLRPWRWSSLRGKPFQTDEFAPQTQCACTTPNCCQAPAPGDDGEVSIAFEETTSRSLAQRAELDDRIELGLSLTGDAAPARCRYRGNRAFKITLEIGR